MTARKQHSINLLVTGDRYFVGDSPIADQRFVGASTNDTEKARFAVISTPRVASDPVINTILISSPAIDLDGVVKEKWFASISSSSLVVRTHSTGVCMNTVCVDATYNRATSHDFSLDILVTPHTAVFLQTNCGILLDGIATCIGIAVHAQIHTISRAVAIDSAILLASDVGDCVHVDPTEGSVGIATVAGARRAAVDQCLNRRN